MPTLTFQPEADRYYAEGYWRDGDLWTDFARRAAASPDKPALILDDRTFTFDQLRRAAVGVSVRLAEGGVKPGDVVILLGRHSIEAAVAMLGCMHRGVVIAPLPPMFNETQLSALIEQTRATGLLGFGGSKELAKCEQVAGQVPLFLPIEPELVDQLAQEDPTDEHAPRHGDDLAMVLHSSGTTSTPKGIAHSNNTLRYATEGICRRWELTGEDIYLVVCEFGFVGGLVFGYFPPLFNGATGVLVNRWNAENALRLIQAHECTYVLSMPTHSADLIEAKVETQLDLPSMRVLAAPGLTRERRVAMQEAFGVPPLGDYGLSEVPGHAAHGLDEPDAKIALTEGRPYDGTEIRIVDDNEQAVAANTVGSVIVNGPSRFLGFLNNDELTRESLTAWGGYRTGDIGYLDEDGQFVYIGRSKDIIRRGGVTIVPAEVEPVIMRHPDVREVAIVPIPDERLGERACAAIIPGEGKAAPTLEELQQFLDQEGVAKYTWPESVEVFEEFPRTPSLKVVKRDVVTQILERAGVTA
ncbi:MAG TPA: AMP-binding protein [Solirubrobacteraceae bacterium]|nr:AMP-binding protein [Solirubrobacteraceae bacterium]